MRVVAVAGCSSGVGKTEVVCRLLRALPGWGAIKASPRARDGFRITVTESSSSPGDSSRYRAAGAVRALWVESARALLGPALEAALLQIGDLPGVVVEGNSAAEAIRPHALLLVARAGRAEVKPAALRLASRASWIVLNHPGGDTGGEIHRWAARLGVPAERIRVANAAIDDDAGTASLTTAVRAWIRP
jgi:molybdopterin-guanine dinucleotide biosynthesis protein